MDGSAFGTLVAPEGVRGYVLFRRLLDIERRSVDESFARHAGRLIAQMHSSSEAFLARTSRFELDLAHLLDEALAAVQRCSGHMPEAIAELSTRVATLRRLLGRMPRGLRNWGPCHGDLHFENIVFTQDGPVLLDFDSSGFGWRLYDLATFMWSIKLKWPGWAVQYTAPDELLWSSFLDAYQEHRQLDPSILKQLPALVAARHVWAIGLQAANADDWATYGWLTDDFVRSQIAFLGDLMAPLT
jgi:Ser/Thr protein kinase RdoA (MazF antagonist)